MEIPIQVAVRIFPKITELNADYIQIVPTTKPVIDDFQANITPGLIKISGRTFPATHVMPFDGSQELIYFHTVLPLIGSFMDGYDVSIVTYGQKNTGKTYTLFGPGFDCIYSEADHGIIQRCIREIFNQISNQNDKQYTLNIGWLELSDDQIHDLLDGLIQANSIEEAFQFLQMGLLNKSDQRTHNSLSLTLEQKWISADGLIQHRLSTFSFCDLAGTERVNVVNSENKSFFQPNDGGLKHLEKIVATLTNLSQVYRNNIDYNQTTLTTMLKDSFGGRAQTLMILCISPEVDDCTETIVNLQFAYQVQLVKNFVVMNTFSDNNTPVNHIDHHLHEQDSFGVQFAAAQWLKLVSNAEGLFRNLITNKTLTEQDREQIEEWMFLKSECEDCFSSSELNMGKLKTLLPIEETDEIDEDNENGNTIQQASDNESDSESHRPDLEDKIENLLDEFRTKTDGLIQEKYHDFKKSHPKAVFDSNDSFHVTEKPVGRRKSIQPGSSLSSVELAMLQKVREKNISDDFLDNSNDMHPMRGILKGKETIKKKLIKVDTEIEGYQRQIKELEHTISLKQKLIADLIRNNDTRTTAKQRFNKKKNKLENEYEKTKKALSKAVINGIDKSEVERLKSATSHLEQRLQDLASIKHIASENGQKVKKLQKSLQESQKQLEILQKSVKKQMKTKETLEAELKEEKTSTLNRGTIKKNNLRDVAARISHLDHVLKEKNQTLEQYSDNGEKESLRHEIRNLRRTRDHLIEQRCHLDKKLKKDKILSHTEERKLLECDEAIEAIDAAIEFKNELICGRKSIDTNEKLQREKGEQMLMARLNKLSTEEMRALIYKYFEKVIDLRDSSRKLEFHLMELERQRDAWEWRERVLSNAVRQARLEGERHAVLLQRQHETKLTLMLRHLAEETSTTNSSMTTDRFLPAQQQQQQHHHNPNHDRNDLELDIYKPSTSKQFNSRQSKYSDHLDLYPLSPSDSDNNLTQYKPLDKFKKERETKNKLFQKIQVFTRYHGNSEKRKQAESNIVIPQENLKQLQSSTVPLTKVTREKNKIIIQQNTTR